MHPHGDTQAKTEVDAQVIPKQPPPCHHLGHRAQAEDLQCRRGRMNQVQLAFGASPGETRKDDDDEISNYHVVNKHWCFCNSHFNTKGHNLLSIFK